MDVLWLNAGQAGFYRAPEEQLIINRKGVLESCARDFFIAPETPEQQQQLLAQAEMLVLVPGAKGFDGNLLKSVPSNLPKLAFLQESTPAEVRKQLVDLGVDGYASVTMDQDDFATVLHKTCDDKRALIALQNDLKNYSSIAFTAMSSASEMGVVAMFAEKVQQAMDLARLARLTLNCASDLGLQAAVQFSFDDDITQFPAELSPTYKRLLRSAIGSHARIVSHGRFLMFSFTQVQLLVSDAPVEDNERYGRLRDVLAHIVSIAESRAKTLKVNSMLKEQQDNARMVMTLLEMASQDNRNSVKNIMTELSLALRTMAMGMDLTLEQEAELLGLAEKALNSLEGLQEATQAVEGHFRSLLQQLDDAASLLEQPEGEQQEEPLADSNVELF